ncbi:hypothetical protein TCAL_04655 [Tigriopus californicus]|uniref:Apple domain-containing protein n=1 Tax=Tigriopus californicus TaxID=6832 RepID=A0A553NCU4_TIGCA|nr:uncharacterized protein LOC131888300 [Tigriopus californicus]TRY63272.1 hypothetical protein TCAL_04655 [Tigriopus californicus]|eukprot:TCALIF_04655-PA protein Name:"Protein of unknown function" AED:0.00 eAED:0.00 QI:58/1/1/1/1/1/2/135/113
MAFRSGWILGLFLLLVVIATSVQAQLSQFLFSASMDIWQPDEASHAIIPLRTDMLYHECANYCTIRGEGFAAGEQCGAFFLKGSDCHLVKESDRDLTVPQTGYHYYSKADLLT